MRGAGQGAVRAGSERGDPTQGYFRGDAGGVLRGETLTPAAKYAALPSPNFGEGVSEGSSTAARPAAVLNSAQGE